MAFGKYDPTIHFLKPTSFRSGKAAKPARSSFEAKQARRADNLNSTSKRSARKPIPKVSGKRKEENKLYEKEKTIWRKERIALDGYLRCEYIQDGVRCSVRASEHPHHKKGRGKLLSRREYFLAVCARHHRYIHDNPAESYEKGWMIKRI